MESYRRDKIGVIVLIFDICISGRITAIDSDKSNPIKINVELIACLNSS